MKPTWVASGRRILRLIEQQSPTIEHTGIAGRGVLDFEPPRTACVGRIEGRQWLDRPIATGIGTDPFENRNATASSSRIVLRQRLIVAADGLQHAAGTVAAQSR